MVNRTADITFNLENGRFQVDCHDATANEFRPVLVKFFRSYLEAKRFRGKWLHPDRDD